MKGFKGYPSQWLCIRGAQSYLSQVFLSSWYRGKMQSTQCSWNSLFPLLKHVGLLMISLQHWAVISTSYWQLLALSELFFSPPSSVSSYIYTVWEIAETTFSKQALNRKVSSVYKQVNSLPPDTYHYSTHKRHQINLNLMQGVSFSGCVCYLELLSKVIDILFHVPYIEVVETQEKPYYFRRLWSSLHGKAVSGSWLFGSGCF